MTYAVKRLSHVAATRTSNVDKKSYDDEATVRLCNYTDVYKNDSITPDMDFMVATATRDQLSKFGLTAGDTVFTKDSETADDIGIPAYVAESAPDLVCGYHLAIARPFAAEADPKFLYWCLASPEAAQQWSVLASGVTRVGLRQSDIGKLEIPIPPLQIQRNVAAFLDRETAQIDDLIGKQERLIELLAEKRQAIITHAVTKGLDPTAPTKSSGVTWLGDIPAHWACKQIKWLTQVRRGASPRPIDNPVYFDENGEWSWVRIADVSASDGTLTSTTQRLSNLGSSLSVKLEPGSLFVSIAGTVGKPCINRIKACIHDGFVYFPTLRIDPQFLFRIFEAGRCYEGLGKMGTQLNLNTDTIGSISVPVPPKDEIEEILTALSYRLHKLDGLSSKITQFRERLIERRAALISAAVTGKIDIRKGAAEQ